MIRTTFILSLLILTTISKEIKDEDGIKLNATALEKRLEEEVIPRFKEHIVRINKRQPQIKQELNLKIKKLTKSLEKIKKRIEEIKVNMQKSINKMEIQDKKRKAAIQKYEKFKKEKAINQMKLAEEEMKQITDKCTKTENILKKMQSNQQRLVKTAERISSLLRIKRKALKKSDEIKNIRVKRNTDKINEITQLIKQYKSTHLLVKNIKDTLNAKKNSGIFDQEYSSLKRKFKQYQRKEITAINQLEDMLKAMTIRQEAKSKFKEKNILKRKKNSATSSVEKAEAKNSMKQINSELNGLKIRVRQNTLMLRALKRKINRATIAYNAKKRNIEGRISRQRMMDMKDERDKLRSTIKNLKKRYNKIERKVLLNEESPEKIADLKKRMTEIINEIKDTKDKYQNAQNGIHQYFEERRKKYEEKKKHIATRKTILEKRIVVLRRIMTLNEKKLSQENSRGKRQVLLRKIKVLSRRIRRVDRSIKSINRRLRNSIIRASKRSERKVILFSKKERLIKKKLARLVVRRKKYNSSEKLVKLIPQIDRLEKEYKTELKQVKTLLKKAEQEANSMEAEVKEINKIREEEAKIRERNLKKRIHVVQNKLQVLNGRKGGKVNDIKAMLKMKIERMKIRANKNHQIALEKKRKVGISRLNKVLRGGVKRIKKIVLLKRHINSLKERISQAQKVMRELGNIVSNGDMKEKIETKRDELKTSINLMTIKKQKEEFVLRKASSSLLRTAGVIRGISEATIQSHQVQHAKLIVLKDKLEKEINQTLINGEEDNEKKNQLYDTNNEIIKTADAINELQIQMGKFSDLVMKVTQGVDDGIKQKSQCEMCTNLARVALKKKKYDGFSTIVVMKSMDNLCRKSKYPTTCYRTLIELGSRVFEEGVTPITACSQINKC
ncbi:DNA repair protein Rad-50, putative [Entamoeba histolytica HM-3:IMSS]|uniref:DNA repair protein Rad-50, putative n=1 Tax=Entamoeba histolytica HM-3:IMSS TaxID=885315 RepID=M7W8P1_ENTHI|nr:DNA repair protein Rad-50, putative [Entamoeba histolytica HM-3:IMSS]